MNRPGLNALAYRVGTHAAFLETMKARLSNMVLEIPDMADPNRSVAAYPLQSLTTRAPDDASIAMLDAWATVGDVLTFYQERIANEGYLRTATERRSILELARLVGYALRPGVAASTFLALELDRGHDVMIQPHEIKAQSSPGPGEQPQTFENIDPLDARYAWNRLQPRLTQPQTIDSILPTVPGKNFRLYVKGVNANLAPNDVVLITVDDQPYENKLFHVAEARPEPEHNRTLVIFQEPPAHISTDGEDGDRSDDPLRRLMTGLTKRGSTPPRNAFRLNRNLGLLFGRSADTSLRLASLFDSRLARWLPVALGNARVAEDSEIRAYVFRVAAPPFGHNAPLKPILGPGGRVIGHKEWPLAEKVKLEVTAILTRPDGGPSSIVVSAERGGLTSEATASTIEPTSTIQLGEITEMTVEIEAPKVGFSFPDLNHSFSATWDETTTKMTVVIGDNVIEISLGSVIEQVIGGVKIKFDLSSPEFYATLRISSEIVLSPNLIALNAKYEQITPGSWAVIERPGRDNPESREQLIRKVVNARRISKAEYGITGEVTQLTLSDSWLYWSDSLLTVLRGTTVFTQSEELALAEEPIETSVGNEATEMIELDGVYSGLQSGRWLIVSGERDDILDEKGSKVRGVHSAELVMLAEVLQQTRVTGDRIHTFITLAEQLEYSYRRASVAIYGNVVKATHGETRRETLGSGEAAQAFQSFALKQAPLTFVSSPTPAGMESTLKVYVNDMQWRKANSLGDLGKTDRKFITKTDDDGKTTIIFGNGQRGARLPAGFENIRAVYRSGMGMPGNVRAEQISLLQSKPLGVKGVKNPLRASGGAEKESRDAARKNAPLTVTALDRLVSVRDYADFSRTFAGVGKAFATRLTDGRRELVHVTIAGAEDSPIDETSDLYRNLLKALRDFGDPHQPIALQVRELKLIVLGANVRILPDYEWEPVVKAIRSTLLDAFSFERRELGQDVLLNELVAAIQSVRGVAYVDVDVFGSIPEKMTDVNDDHPPVRRLLTPQEMATEATKFLDNTKIKRPDTRVRVNLAGIEDKVMHPAQLAYLTPDVADTLVLNQIR